MVNYCFALAALLSLPTAQAFSVPRSLNFPRDHARSIDNLIQNGPKRSLKRDSATTLYDNIYPDEDASVPIQSVISNATATYIDALSEMVADEEDVYEAEAALKKKVVEGRSGNFEVTIPLDETSSLGFSVCEVNSHDFSDLDLNFDTLRMQEPAKESSSTDEGSLQTMDQNQIRRQLPRDMKGVIVSSVVRGGWAWNEGIRPGDVLKATSATLGKVSL